MSSDSMISPPNQSRSMYGIFGNLFEVNLQH